MELEFEKWHGNKNDFILTWFDHDQVAFDALRRQAPALCQRDGGGIGADGILVLHTKTARDLMPYKLSIINSDGSLAQTCGNGIRCAALSVLTHHIQAEQKVEVPDAIGLQLESSTVSCRYLGRLTPGRSGQLPLVAVEMGQPIVNKENQDYSEVKTIVEHKAKELGLPALARDWHLVSISNRHLCFFLDRVNRDMIRHIGPAFQTSSLWDGINVHICASKVVQDDDRRTSAQVLNRPIDELFEVFVWERGAGETQACGSGASAIGASAFASGLTDRRNWLGIDMPGGRLYVKQENASDSVTLAGPGHMVFRGRLVI
jgi:diaminopimelate epimerase